MVSRSKLNKYKSVENETLILLYLINFSYFLIKFLNNNVILSLFISFY